MGSRILTPHLKKVKVLLVLYDGDSHARDVSYTRSFFLLN